MKARFISLIGGASLAFLFVIYALFRLQIDTGDIYSQRARAQQMIGAALAAERGSILLTDKNGSAIPAAVNKEYPLIYAVPDELEDVREATEQLAALFSLDAEELGPRLSRTGDKYEALLFKASEAAVTSAREAGIKGLYVAGERGRLYPFESLASQLLGFVSHGDEEQLPTGQYGIEKQYQAVLAGTPAAFDDRERLVPGVPGTDVQLTIDHTIQARAEEILSGLVEKYGAVGGSVIVQEPATGKIMALANEPAFNPNEYGKVPIAHFINPAVQGLYEPGSVFKPITMAAALDSGAITPETTFYDPGYFTADGKTIKNWDLKAHGQLTMTNVIEQSINTGTVFAEKKTGHKTFYEYLLRFGFKELTQIDLPGEMAGRLTPLEKHPRDINFATASYGQGVAVTPIRLITSISAIANGGMLRDAYVRAGGERPPVRRVISERAARQVTDMMVAAVRKAKVAAIPEYQIAGKTGTAFKPDFQNGGYSDKVINTYVGYAPAYAPRFTILIKLDEPENAPLAGTTVVPAFKELAQFLLNYYNVPPDHTSPL